MAALELGEPEAFPFVDPPDTRQINDGYRLLQELKAVDDARRVTSLGRQISTLPLDPRLARMLIAASHHRCLAEMLIIASFLAAQDPRERPSDAQQQADQKHAVFHDPRSDFITVLNLWNAAREQAANLSGSQLRKWHRESFLSFIRMREWQELHRQLGELIAELKLRPNETPAEYADLHQAVLTGFLGGVGALDERREYEGARGSRFVIAPGTPLAAKPPKWVVAAQLVETTRLYARMTAAVEPQWIEAAGEHLLKRSYSEPHWVEERGFVAAYESTSLYGLTLAARRRVNYGAVAPREAQEIFVREALVEGRTRRRAGFLEHNRRVRREIEHLEAKVRRRDILVDEQAMCDFYLARLPEDVHSTAALEKWLRRRPHEKEKVGGKVHAQRAPGAALTMTPRDLMRRDAPEVTPNSYPDAWPLAGNELPIQYRFEPGAPDDGATILLPLPLLSAAQPEAFSNPPEGWRLEKITETLRALPKAIRKAFVPVPEHAQRAASEIDSRREFNAALAEWITRESGAVTTPEQIAALPLPDHLRFNLRVIGLNGSTIAEGRDLNDIKRKVRHSGEQPAMAAPANQAYRAWEFGELPRERAVERRGLRFTVYPTLHDRGDSVEVAEAPTVAEADASLRAGVLRLAMLALPEQFKYARKRFAEERELVLLAQGLESVRPLADSMAVRAFADCFLRDLDDAPRSAEAFRKLLDERRAAFGDVVDRVLAHTLEILREARGVRQKLNAMAGPAFEPMRRDIAVQLGELLPADFPANARSTLWPHTPRFLKAISRRLDKAHGNHKRDAELMSKVTPAMRALEQLRAHSHAAHPRTELDRLQWLIEELRVSLYAQDLRTALPASEKRVAEQVDKARAEARAV
jgi:ATP-dependent helicase HrpA